MASFYPWASQPHSKEEGGKGKDKDKAGGAGFLYLLTFSFFKKDFSRDKKNMSRV